ncbi:MAG TPA: glycogen synthase, partial [Cytophagales bacterium]|nr:glycogen synthase [Cytophagales bacterium]
MTQRILWLTETYPPQRGGMAQSCDRLVSGLRQRSLTVDVLHFTGQVKRPVRVQEHGGEYLPLSFADSEAHT